MDAKSQEQTQEQDELAALKSAALTAGDVPTRVMLAPWGQVESSNGSFIVDEESARLVQQAFARHGTDLPIDYEHQTLGGTYASPNGQAPAAGWIKAVEAEPDVGLMALIEWTDPAKELLGTKQYRYLSPVAIIRKSDRKMVALHSAALTNKPAIAGMKPIVNRASPQVREAHADLLETLRGTLSLPAASTVDEVLVAAGARLEQLQQQEKERQVRERVEAAMRSGRLVETQRTWAETLAARDASLFEEWLRTAPVVVALGRTAPPDGGPSAPNAQTVAQRARAEFRAHPLLTAVTSEEAYVADAQRHAEE
jgi:phage I-like protein